MTLLRSIGSVRWGTALLLLAVVVTSASCRGNGGRSHPSPVESGARWLHATVPVPDGLGYNIHFTRPRPGELELLSASGVSWVRMDLFWAEAEKSPGVYDFAAYDHLVALLTRHRLRALFILDYGNPLYDGGQAPRSPTARAAFVRFAVAAVERYAGRGYLWEIWNEPNGQFWLPAADASAYSALLIETSAALKRSRPDEVVVAPALAGIDLPFLSACIRNNAFRHIDALTVHPYRQDRPETVVGDYQAVRQLLLQSELGHLPVLSGEWGYSAVWSGFDPSLQADMLARQWLVNLSQGIPVSIWYDWRNDGTNDHEPEHHFGTVEHAQLIPKPSYHAAAQLIDSLRGFTFAQRLHVTDDPGVWALVFARKGSERREVRVVVWRASGSAADVQLPATAGRRYLAQAQSSPPPVLSADAHGNLRVPLTSTPTYLTPETDCPVWTAAAEWNAGPSDVFLSDLKPREVRSLRARVVSGPAERTRDGTRFALPSLDPDPVPVVLQHESIPSLRRQVLLIPVNPIRLTLAPSPDGTVIAQVQTSPASRTAPLEARLELIAADSPSGLAMPIRLGTSTDAVSVVFPASSQGSSTGGPWTAGLRLTDPSGRVLATLPPRAFEPYSIGPTGFSTTVEGNPSVSGSAEARQDSEATILTFTKPQSGWKYALLKPAPDAVEIAGQPDAVGMWVFADGSAGGKDRPATICIRFRDRTGQVFQAKGPPLDWSGWRFVRFAMTQPGLHSWGGAKDGQIHYPIQWDTLVLLDPRGEWTGTGSIRVRGIVTERSVGTRLENPLPSP